MLLSENRIKTLIYTVLWIIYATVHFLSMCLIVSAPIWALIVDALIHASIFAGIGIMLWFVLMYAKYETLPLTQQYINFGILACFVSGLWTGAGYFFEYILMDETAYDFAITLPIKGLIGLMLYVIFVLYFYVNIKPSSNSDEMFAETEVPDISDISDGENPETIPETIERLTVKTKQGIHLIQLGDIVYLQSYNDYVQIVTKNGKYLKEQTMKYFETHLPKTFVRIHRSYIINIEYISSIESSGKQNQQVSLKTGEWLKMSQIGYRTLKSVLNL